MARSRRKWPRRWPTARGAGSGPAGGGGGRGAAGPAGGPGVRGIAGPGGGTEDKPVGFVCFWVAGPEGARLTRSATLPGARVDIRDRSTTVAMHLVRRLLRGEGDAPGA